MNRADIDTALDLLNEIVYHLQLAVEGGFVPSADLQQCLNEYDALLDVCASVPFEVVSNGG